MTKITIKAASLEITIDGTKQEASFITAALATLMAHIISAAQGDEFVEDEPDAPVDAAPGPAPAEPAPADAPTTTGVDVSAEHVLAFLRSDDQLEYRTLGAILNYFNGEVDTAEVMGILDYLTGVGAVIRKQRRGDGAGLYKAAPLPAEIPGVPEVAGIFAVHPTFNLENLRTFLTSDSRYTCRSLDPIVKHFGFTDVVGVEGLLGTLAMYVEDGDIERTTRRRDSMPLYGVA